MIDWNDAPFYRFNDKIRESLAKTTDVRVVWSAKPVSIFHEGKRSLMRARHAVQIEVSHGTD